MTDRRSREHHLYVQGLGPREREALHMISTQPGITVAELQDALGVGQTRAWQIVTRLQRPRVWLAEQADPRWPVNARDRP